VRLRHWAELNTLSRSVRTNDEAASPRGGAVLGKSGQAAVQLAMVSRVRSIVRSALDIVGVLEPICEFKRKLADRKIQQAFDPTRFKKLNLGCGNNPLPGWFNADLNVEQGVFRLDATKPFPFPSNSFEEIFTEHMIEHISYTDALAMLKECYRVLRPGGKLRVTTPDLKFLIALYEPTTELQRRYIKWATDLFVPWAPRPNSAFIINNFVRDWGHTFIFDEPTLREAFERAGFENIKSCPLGPLENKSRMPDGFLQLESFTLEGTKSGQANMLATDFAT
jgi:predicted SAM-dependent methyltransferase